MKKFKGFNAINPKMISGILLGIVIVETLLLVRVYFKEQSAGKETPRSSVVLTTKDKKIPAKKVAARMPQRAQPVIAVTPTPTVSKSRGRIAIIVDDNGYNLRDCHYLKEIASPVTISILPNIKHSTEMAKCAHAYKKEVMLHLPMEPHENLDEYPKEYILNTEMPKGLIIDRLEESLKSVPYADGVNNHMGSKATENRRLMTILFAQLLAKNLFFVDSRVTSKTVGPRLARETGLSFAQRDVFLDNVNERGEIEAEFAELAKLAEKQGFAIGISHARKLSWQIIKEQTEKLKKEGFEIVPVRTIVDQINP